MIKNIAKARRHLARARELSSRAQAPTRMKESTVIAKIRKDRQAIWEAKIASRS